MPLFGRDRNRISNSVTQALAHPIRLRILDLSTRDPTRPLTASTFFPDLAGEFDGLSLSQVRYHLDRLQDAELLPAG
jgi:DNA-binding transcriptional ArsR family regulator